MAVSASEARSRLFPLIQQVNDDHVPVRISSKGGDAVLMSAEDFARGRRLFTCCGLPPTRGASWKPSAGISQASRPSSRPWRS